MIFEVTENFHKKQKHQESLFEIRGHRHKDCQLHAAENVLRNKFFSQARLKNMLVSRHPGLFFRVYPAGRKIFFIILRWKR